MYLHHPGSQEIHVISESDFDVSESIIRDGAQLERITLVFKSKQGNILAYMQFNVELKPQQEPITYFIDTTSASGYPHFSDQMKRIYACHDYSQGAVKKGFGTIAFTYALKYIQSKYPQNRIVLMAAHWQNEGAIWDLIERVQDSTNDVIEKITGGNDMHVATIFLKR